MIRKRYGRGIQTLNKIVKHLKDGNDTGLTSHKFDIPSIKIVMLADTSFGNGRGLRRQLGFVILMIDNNGVSNIIHYGSSRCKRITRSVMASEIHALFLCFDKSYYIRHMLEEILGRRLNIEAYVDSKTVFDVIAKDGKRTERIIRIDVSALK